MPGDLIVRNALVAPGRMPADIGVRDGRIAFVGHDASFRAAAQIDAGGRVVVPGFVETHIHLDKSQLCDRCGTSASLEDAIARVSALKSSMTEQDIYQRSRRTLEQAILQGTNRMRVHVEVDRRIGLRGFEAMKALKREFAWAISLQICVFAQEGMTDDPECMALIVAALRSGADLIGGCPYADVDPSGHIDWVFETAREHDVDIDFHLDFDLSPERMDLHHVCRRTAEFGWGGRVSVGHVTKLAALAEGEIDGIAAMLSDAGVAVTALPATDMFLVGRRVGATVPRTVAPVLELSRRGVLCSLATNNVMNPFTPFGDCSLVRMANFMLNVSQRGDEEAALSALAMIGEGAARLMNRVEHGIAAGNPADLVLIDAASHVEIVRRIALPLLGLKDGAISFSRDAGRLHWPGSEARAAPRDRGIAASFAATAVDPA